MKYYTIEKNNIDESQKHTLCERIQVQKAIDCMLHSPGILDI